MAVSDHIHNGTLAGSGQKGQTRLPGLASKDLASKVMISAVRTRSNDRIIPEVASGLVVCSVSGSFPRARPLSPLCQTEVSELVAGPNIVAGIDEAGRGCLAGPVVAAAVILPAGCQLDGLADSKKIPAKKRQILQEQIRNVAVGWAIGLVRPERIDGINILEATLEAMALAAGRLRPAPQALLIDGNKVIPSRVLERHWTRLQALPTQKAIVDGDAIVPVISAASILAKTFRDRIMEAMDRRWPDYGFARHKGYGTSQHYAALARCGPCPQHRLSFRGVKA